jgi:mRNA-degrading endonuclease RelE of RelBE toxin-antitoxin system
MSDEWAWELSETAQDDLDAFSADEQDRILDKLDEVVASPNSGWRSYPQGAAGFRLRRKHKRVG